MKTLAWCSLSKPYCCWLVYIGDLLRRCEQSMIVGAPAGALIGGFFGYISGRKVSETVYDVVTQKGMPIGGR